MPGLDHVGDEQRERVFLLPDQCEGVFAAIGGEGHVARLVDHRAHQFPHFRLVIDDQNGFLAFGHDIPILVQICRFQAR